MLTTDKTITTKEFEVFTDIADFEGLYQIGSFGAVLSFKNGIRYVLKPEVTRLKYLRVALYKKHYRIRKLVHVLVADAYIPNPNNLPEINHLKGNKADCRWFMLERSTRKQNIRHAFETGLSKPRFGLDNSFTKIILNTQTGIFYYGNKEAADSCEINWNYLKSMLSGHNKNKTSFIYT